jgi:hypothetical protein
VGKKEVELDRIISRKMHLVSKLRQQATANPPPAADVADLHVHPKLKAIVAESMWIARETERAGAPTDATTLIHQRISQEDVDFSEEDLVKVAQWLGVGDIPAWFEELASWL